MARNVTEETHPENKESDVVLFCSWIYWNKLTNEGVFNILSFSTADTNTVHQPNWRRWCDIKVKVLWFHRRLRPYFKPACTRPSSIDTVQADNPDKGTKKMGRVFLGAIGWWRMATVRMEWSICHWPARLPATQDGSDTLANRSNQASGLRWKLW